MKTMNNTGIMMVALTVVVAICPVLSGDEISAVPPREKESVKQGLSDADPIVVTEKDIKKAEEFAEKYIKDHYSGYKIICISMMANMANGHVMEIYTLKKTDKDAPEKTETLRLHFDVEAAMVEFRKENAAEIRTRLKHIKIIRE